MVKEVIALKEEGNEKFTSESLNWLRNLEKLKSFTSEEQSEDLVNYLPSTLRHLSHRRSAMIPAVKCVVKERHNFPYLISIKEEIRFEDAEKLNLRSVKTFFGGGKEVLTFRPRRVSIMSFTSRYGHRPEIFEKVEYLRVACEFDLDCLTDRIKKLEIGEVDLESTFISRF